MNKPFYTDYVRHCMRFYARNRVIDRFNTEVDKYNWYACHRTMECYSDKDKEVLLQVYGLRDTLADNVYETSNTYSIHQNLIWNLLKDFEYDLAKNRGLI